MRPADAPGAPRPRRPATCPVCPGERRLEVLRHPEDVSPFIMRWCSACNGVWGSNAAFAGGVSSYRRAHPALMAVKAPLRCHKCHAFLAAGELCAKCGWSRRPLSCPECELPMDAVMSNKVDTDACRQCGGIWLDGGEIAQLFGVAQSPPLRKAYDPLGAGFARAGAGSWEEDRRPSGGDVISRFFELIFRGVR